jgi:type I restriction enzyme S subunit
LIPKGTVVLTIAANVGDISILGFDACFPDSVVGFLPDSELERDYFYLALSVMKRQFMVSSIQNTQMNLNVDRIGSNSIAIPPLPEQRAIIKWADEITGFSEAAKTKLTDEICALRELKSTLVANVVTGNLKI